jgi:hypothetical protein
MRTSWRLGKQVLIFGPPLLWPHPAEADSMALGGPDSGNRVRIGPVALKQRSYGLRRAL